MLRWLRDLRWSCLQSAGPSARRARSGCAPSAPRNTEQDGDKWSIQGPAARARERKPKRAGVRTLWRKRKMRLMGWVIIRCTLVDAMAGALLLLAPRAAWSTRDGEWKTLAEGGSAREGFTVRRPSSSRVGTAEGKSASLSLQFSPRIRIFKF